MNNRTVNEFLVLLKRELWESRRLFIASPIVLTGLLLVASLWALLRVPAEFKTQGLELMSGFLQGLNPYDLVVAYMTAAIPFMLVLYVCVLIYLVSSLYHDRKEGSILFWQSMPVSNLMTVLSKVATVTFVAPLFVAAASGVLVVFAVIAISMLGSSYEIEVAGFWSLLFAGFYSVGLVYLTAILAALWLFPSIGWFLMFSAYARSLPFLWAIGAFILLLFLEDFVFGSQFLGNWLQSRTSGNNYIIFSFTEFFQRLFSYDLLIGVALGSILITGAVYMRRYTD